MDYNTQYMDELLKTAARAGGKVLLKHFLHHHKISYKTSHQDFYTQADVESQEAIKQSIIGQMAKKGVSESEIGFIGEENLNVASRKHLFIIDPLDGTTNYSSGLDLFAVSIAYCLNGEIIEGVIYRPTTDDLYYAKKGAGAFKNDRMLTLGSKPLKSCLVDGIISSRPNIYPKMFKILQNIFTHTKGLRSLFCMTLSSCFISENIVDIGINGNTYIWDIAASGLVLNEAGGIMFDFKGQPIQYRFDDPKHSYQVVCCHPDIKVEVLNYVK